MNIKRQNPLTSTKVARKNNALFIDRIQNDFWMADKIRHPNRPPIPHT